MQITPTRSRFTNASTEKSEAISLKEALYAIVLPGVLAALLTALFYAGVPEIITHSLLVGYIGSLIGLLVLAWYKSAAKRFVWWLTTAFILSATAAAARPALAFRFHAELKGRAGTREGIYGLLDALLETSTIADILCSLTAVVFGYFAFRLGSDIRAQDERLHTQDERIRTLVNLLARLRGKMQAVQHASDPEYVSGVGFSAEITALADDAETVEAAAEHLKSNLAHELDFIIALAKEVDALPGRESTDSTDEDNDADDAEGVK